MRLFCLLLLSSLLFVASADGDDCSLKNVQDTCTYVKTNSDACEGGGYLLWSRYVECAPNTTAKVFTIIGGVLWMLWLFVMISSAADDFFSPNVAAIVAHLKISESVAGVTFLAFGNGAPDIFGSIASVLSSSKPKAGLALGELLGAGIFVTTMVFATIILTKPFKAEKFAPIRDISFYLAAVGWILFVFLHSSTIEVYEPAVTLAMYGVYVITVIIAQSIYTRRRKRKAAKRNGSAHQRRSTHRGNSVSPTIPEVIVENTDKDAPPMFTIFPPVNMPEAFGHEKENDSLEDEVLVVHNKVYVGEDARERVESIAPPPIPINNWKMIFWDIFDHLKPLPNKEDWEDSNIAEKVLFVVKIIPMLFFKATIPMNESSWSKSIALVYALLAPIFFVFAIKVIGVQPFGGPGLWLYALVVSAVLFFVVLIFTSFDREPRFYREVYSYLGFLLSLAWMYFIAAEVVDVVSMIGMVSRLSHEVLGLTILAWSNSIGDLIADVSVAKQGFCRMAMAAAIGGPLFNLLMGFGIPFTIATAIGRTVDVSFTPIYHILVLFLAISLLTTFIGLLVQSFSIRRWFGFVLIGIYVAFLVMVVLTETKVVVWGHAT